MKCLIAVSMMYSLCNSSFGACLLKVRGVGIKNNTLKITVDLLEKQTSKKIDDILENPYIVSRKLPLKVCNFEGNKGHLSSKACLAMFRIIEKTEKTIVKINLPSDKSCGSIKCGDWISGIKTLNDQDI
ncbi:MAG: hypothetical protein AB8C84_01480 [Oligoflexales bacterium]